jgi:hypothetical protein
MPYKSKYDLSSKSIRIYKRLVLLQHSYNTNSNLIENEIKKNKNVNILNFQLCDEYNNLSDDEYKYFQDVLQYFGLKIENNCSGIIINDIIQ